MRVLRDFLLWWRERLSDLSVPINANILARTSTEMQDGKWTPEEIIERYSNPIFTIRDYDNWEWIFSIWIHLSGLEGSRKPRGVYKPKNLLDGFLRVTIKGKYNWRRYEIFSQYLQTACGLSKQDTVKAIAKYQEYGVENVRAVLSIALSNWIKSRKKVRGTNAAEARWGKTKMGKNRAIKGEIQGPP